MPHGPNPPHDMPHHPHTQDRIPLIHNGQLEELPSGLLPPPPAPRVKEGQYVVTTPGDADVLCGRGSRVNNHPGNVHFRQFVSRYKDLYLREHRRKVEKAHICAFLVDQLRTSTGARFLKFTSDNTWEEIGDLKARKKAGQALREDATEINVALSQEKQALSSAAMSSSSSGANQNPYLVVAQHFGLTDTSSSIMTGATVATTTTAPATAPPTTYVQPQPPPQAHVVSNNKPTTTAATRYCIPLKRHFSLDDPNMRSSSLNTSSSIPPTKRQDTTPPTQSCSSRVRASSSCRPLTFTSQDGQVHVTFPSQTQHHATNNNHHHYSQPKPPCSHNLPVLQSCSPLDFAFDEGYSQYQTLEEEDDQDAQHQQQAQQQQPLDNQQPKATTTSQSSSPPLQLHSLEDYAIPPKATATLDDGTGCLSLSSSSKLLRESIHSFSPHSLSFSADHAHRRFFAASSSSPRRIICHEEDSFLWDPAPDTINLQQQQRQYRIDSIEELSTQMSVVTLSASLSTIVNHPHHFSC